MSAPPTPGNNENSGNGDGWTHEDHEGHEDVLRGLRDLRVDYLGQGERFEDVPYELTHSEFSKQEVRKAGNGKTKANVSTGPPSLFLHSSLPAFLINSLGSGQNSSGLLNSSTKRRIG